MKTVSLPYYLQPLHGKEPFLRDILLTYLVALQISAGTWIYCQQVFPEWIVWKKLLLCLVFADTAAGIFSNYTHATARYYEDQLGLRLLFIGLHFFYPLVVLWTMDMFSFRNLLPGIFAIFGAYFVNTIRYKNDQKILAVFIYIVGSGIILKAGLSQPALMWFYLMLMFKLIMSFAIKRH
jgi:hypothetical protein